MSKFGLKLNFSISEQKAALLVSPVTVCRLGAAFPYLGVCLYCLFETASYYVTLTALEVSKCWINGVCHHVWLLMKLTKYFYLHPCHMY